MMTIKTKIISISVAAVLVVSVVVICSVVLVAKNKTSKEGCELNPFEVNLAPIIVLSGSTHFLYPKWGEKVLKFSPGETLDFICPGSTVLLGSDQSNNSLLTGTCSSGSTFRVGGKENNWKDMRCTNTHWRDIRATGKTCASDGQELEAGFNVADGRFLRVLLICFNTQMQIAYYTYINQTASINQRDLFNPRPSFIQGSKIYNIGQVNSLYLRNNQRATINKLVGLPSNSTKYIQNDSNYFLARGHLTARSDCFYGAQQNATFFYQNVAPQWQTFNGYNWNQVEIDLRDYASERGVDLQVWTGVHGVTTLPHETTEEEVELYLYVNGTRKALPVPEIYWKVAYNPLEERGIALIGVNNPYKGYVTKICYDVSSRISWLHCDKTNQEYGFCYACSITTFRYVVTSMPNVYDRGLLL